MARTSRPRAARPGTKRAAKRLAVNFTRAFPFSASTGPRQIRIDGYYSESFVARGRARAHARLGARAPRHDSTARHQLCGLFLAKGVRIMARAMPPPRECLICRRGRFSYFARCITNVC